MRVRSRHLGVGAVLAAYGVAAALAWASPAAGQEVEKKGEAAPPAEAGAASDPIVAQAGEVRITLTQFQEKLEALPPERRALARARPGEFLRALVREEVLHQAALQAGLDKDPALLKKVEEARRSLLVDELLRRNVIEKATISDDAVRKAYEENKADYETENVTASHIMVRTQEEAEGILKDLQGGKDFADLAKEKSIDRRSAANGGSLGTFGRGATPPEFEEAAFKLQAGETSPVVKTQFGYHVIRVTDHVKGVKGFDEVKEEIRKGLLEGRQQEVFAAYMAGVEQGTKVQVFEERLKAK